MNILTETMMKALSKIQGQYPIPSTAYAGVSTNIGWCEYNCEGTCGDECDAGCTGRGCSGHCTDGCD